MRVAVFGMGYVGLVTAAGLAKWGHEVIGIEVDHERLDALRAGRLPLFEPGLDALVEAGVAGKRLRFTDDVEGIGSVQVAGRPTPFGPASRAWHRIWPTTRSS